MRYIHNPFLELPAIEIPRDRFGLPGLRLPAVYDEDPFIRLFPMDVSNRQAKAQILYPGFPHQDDGGLNALGGLVSLGYEPTLGARGAGNLYLVAQALAGTRHRKELIPVARGLYGSYRDEAMAILDPSEPIQRQRISPSEARRIANSLAFITPRFAPYFAQVMYFPPLAQRNSRGRFVQADNLKAMLLDWYSPQTEEQYQEAVYKALALASATTHARNRIEALLSGAPIAVGNTGDNVYTRAIEPGMTLKEAADAVNRTSLDLAMSGKLSPSRKQQYLPFVESVGVDPATGKEVAQKRYYIPSSAVSATAADIQRYGMARQGALEREGKPWLEPVSKTLLPLEDQTLAAPSALVQRFTGVDNKGTQGNKNVPSYEQMVSFYRRQGLEYPEPPIDVPRDVPDVRFSSFESEYASAFADVDEATGGLLSRILGNGRDVAQRAIEDPAIVSRKVRQLASAGIIQPSLELVEKVRILTGMALDPEAYNLNTLMQWSDIAKDTVKGRVARGTPVDLFDSAASIPKAIPVTYGFTYSAEGTGGILPSSYTAIDDKARTWLESAGAIGGSAGTIPVRPIGNVSVDINAPLGSEADDLPRWRQEMERVIFAQKHLIPVLRDTEARIQSLEQAIARMVHSPQQRSYLARGKNSRGIQPSTFRESELRDRIVVLQRQAEALRQQIGDDLEMAMAIDRPLAVPEPAGTSPSTVASAWEEGKKFQGRTVHVTGDLYLPEFEPSGRLSGSKTYTGRKARRIMREMALEAQNRRRVARGLPPTLELLGEDMPRGLRRRPLLGYVE